MSTGQAIIARYLAESDHADTQLKLRLQAWRDGYTAGRASREDDYEHGYTDAQADLKAIQHGIIRDLRQHLATWDGLREHFGRPRPSDVQPRTRRAGAA